MLPIATARLFSTFPKTSISHTLNKLEKLSQALDPIEINTTLFYREGDTVLHKACELYANLHKDPTIQTPETVGRVIEVIKTLKRKGGCFCQTNREGIAPKNHLETSEVLTTYVTKACRSDKPRCTPLVEIRDQVDDISNPQSGDTCS